MSSPYGFRERVRIVLALGWIDFALKYRGSVLGYLWSFIVPLAQFLILLFLFRPFLGEAIAHYPLYLFMGIIVWEHFVLTTTTCQSVLQEKWEIIQRVPVPRLLLELAVGWQHLLIFLTRLMIFFVFFLFLGGPLTVSILLLPLALLQMTLFALGVGMTLASYALKFRDIPHLWSVLLPLFFFLTPIFYAPESVPLRSADSFHVLLRAFVGAQPLSTILGTMREAFLGEFIPHVTSLLTSTLQLTIFFVLAAFLFRYRSRFFLEEY